MRKSKLMAFFVLVGIVASALLFFTLFAHGSTKSRLNTVGVAQIYENPYVYIFGAATDIHIFTDGVQQYTNVMFQPFGASLLYSENILFVGTPIEHTGFYIVTYERAAGRVLQGVPAHYVLKAFEIGGDK